MPVPAVLPFDDIDKGAMLEYPEVFSIVLWDTGEV
jgi:hypothetical protein